MARQANPGALEEMPVSVTDEQRLDKRPFGPAIVDSEERAVNTIMRRLNADKEAIVSIDLEGHQLGAGGQVSLVQLAIDEGLDGEPQPNYSTSLRLRSDVPRTSAVIFGRRAQSLCNMVEDSERVKVLHCLHVDAMALFKGYGVTVEGVFDMGVADSLALSGHSGANEPGARNRFHGLAGRRGRQAHVQGRIHTRTWHLGQAAAHVAHVRVCVRGCDVLQQGRNVTLCFRGGARGAGGWRGEAVGGARVLPDANIDAQ